MATKHVLMVVMLKMALRHQREETILEPRSVCVSQLGFPECFGC